MALELFIAECSATSLKSDDEMGGSLASTLQKRHKIRNTDLKTLFDKTNPMAGDYWNKVYMVFTLICYAGAAYRDLAPLIASNANALGNVQVVPHWDPTGTHALSGVYDWEPMNLFPGWSLTNTRNNQEMLDPHILFWNDTTKVLSTDLHGLMRGNGTKDTEGMSMAKALYRPDYNTLHTRLDNDQLQGRTRRYSAYSNHLADFNKQNLKEFEHFNGSNQRSLSLDRAKKKFKELSERLKENTRAGERHYERMLTSLTTLNLTQSAIFSGLTAAKNNWTLHRKKNIDLMDFYLRALDTWNPQHAFDMTLPSK